MRDIQLASFAHDQESIFAAMLALASLQKSTSMDITPIVLAPNPVIEAFEAQYPAFHLKPVFKKLGGELVTAFHKGYNWNLGFRPAMAQIVNKTSANHALLYFSPRMVFFGDELFEYCQDEDWAARQPDDFWPHIELYGPSMTEIWSEIIQTGEGELSDWINPEFPEGYWRRYPTASPHLFYTTRPEQFANVFGEINNLLSDEMPQSLQGQGHIPAEAVIAASMIKMGGKIIDPEWDLGIKYYTNFYNLLLRLNDEQALWLTDQILEKNPIRQIFKTIAEYKLIFYQAKIPRIRDGFDLVERNFGILRMDELIQRRKIRQKIRKRLKEQENKPLM